MAISSYSTIPDNNNAAPPNGAPEGMAAGQINNVIRQTMADTKSFYDEVRLHAYKAASTFRNSVTTIADDPDLTLSLTAGTYRIESFLEVGGSPGTAFGGIKYDYGYTGTIVSMRIHEGGYLNGAAIAAARATDFNTPRSIASMPTQQNHDSDCIVHTGYVIVSNSGTFSFRWAQNSSTATNTFVFAGSYIKLVKLS